MKQTKTWFSIIEVMVGIFIFTVGLVWVYALILSSMQLNDYSKNSIIASNLARESIEMVRNIRDSNFKNLEKWDSIPGSNGASLFQTGVYFTLENDINELDHQDFELKWISNFVEGKNMVPEMENYRLCLTPESLYTYHCDANTTKTPFYRYIVFQDLPDFSANAKKVTTKVIWNHRGYHEVQMDTILTDFLRR